MNDSKASVPIKLSYDANSLKERPAKVNFIADEATKAALAGYAGLVEVLTFKAEFEIARSGRAGAKVSGKLDADIVQICSVTLDPFPAQVHEAFEVKFVPEAMKRPNESKPLRKNDIDLEAIETQVSLTEEDPPEEIRNGRIDLGALATEFFVLGLDPYPRKPDADLAMEAAEVKNLEIDAAPLPEVSNSPFAGLATLKEPNKS